MNHEAAEAAKDQGTQRALNHADRTRANWSDDAVDLLRQYVAEIGRPFRLEEFRVWSADHIEPPAHFNAWGAVAMKAQKAGIIEFRGYGKTSRKEAHRRVSAIWGRPRIAA